MTSLLELAERAEKVTGPDRELDIAIWRLVDPKAIEVEAQGRRPLPWLHRYTASLDAAMTLYVEVPERVPPNPRLATAEALRQRAGDL
ncbi:hypothetical protein [Sphingomonas sp.]|uniref:hypothetical protein n=1 Tax=Sphingomonas sp. TaxID=28214 RepID=UPI003B3A71F5